MMRLRTVEWFEGPGGGREDFEGIGDGGSAQEGRRRCGAMLGDRCGLKRRGRLPGDVVRAGDAREVVGAKRIRWGSSGFLVPNDLEGDGGGAQRR
ncbi:hypothetical protein BVRB_017870 [Beta vulgaris subsp. vulgaris]|uniref:Uncharacterized protein n=1 Tax=Beta vulgaris subsp. vulgaris TaxID=3555 RepID=A0A0J7YM46_BETVV|nr:hypothetical protein BVRB_017870 [Beta vulgaris subsp. vulgaris]